MLNDIAKGNVIKQNKNVKFRLQVTCLNSFDVYVTNRQISNENSVFSLCFSPMPTLKRESLHLHTMFMVIKFFSKQNHDSSTFMNLYNFKLVS